MFNSVGPDGNKYNVYVKHYITNLTGDDRTRVIDSLYLNDSNLHFDDKTELFEILVVITHLLILH